MMDDVGVESWLAAEASDHLDDGPVGLYEFLWWLNGSRFQLSPTAARSVAQRLATHLAGSDAVDLYSIRWPTYEVVSGPLPLSVLDDDGSWREGHDFVALVPSEDATGRRVAR